jgi:hypothetical protein
MDDSANELSYTAFDGPKRIASGELAEVVLSAKRRRKKHDEASIQIFNDASGKSMDFDFSGSDEDVLKRLGPFLSKETPAAPVGPGRPKLGVVAREVSLLPRHWEWLATQSGGASATLRRLVEDAKKSSVGKNRVKQAQERTYFVMLAMSGDFPHYEEALRALYKREAARFRGQIESWPKDVREYLHALSLPVFAQR